MVRSSLSLEDSEILRGNAWEERRAKARSDLGPVPLAPFPHAEPSAPWRPTLPRPERGSPAASNISSMNKRSATTDDYDAMRELMKNLEGGRRRRRSPRARRPLCPRLLRDLYRRQLLRLRKMLRSPPSGMRSAQTDGGTVPDGLRGGEVHVVRRSRALCQRWPRFPRARLARACAVRPLLPFVAELHRRPAGAARHGEWPTAYRRPRLPGGSDNLLCPLLGQIQ